jgi:hypothetical protein
LNDFEFIFLCSVWISTSPENASSILSRINCGSFIPKAVFTTLVVLLNLKDLNPAQSDKIKGVPQ